MNFALSVDHWLKIKGSKKMDKCLNLARQLKKQWNMKVTVIQVVFGTLGTISKCLEKKLEELKIRGRIKTIWTTALLRTARYLEECRKPEEIYCYLDSSEKPQIKTGVKNLQI